MNYTNLYERIRIRINAQQTLTKSQKIAVKAIALECLADQMKEDQFGSYKEQNVIDNELVNIKELEHGK